MNIAPTAFEASSTFAADIFGSQGLVLLALAMTAIAAIAVVAILGARLQLCCTAKLNEIEQLIKQDDTDA